MSDFIKAIRTTTGDKQIDYNSLANLPTIPFQYIESLDTSNLVNLRDLESGCYVLYGKFRPYAGAANILTFSSSLQVNVVTKTAGTHVQVLYPVNNVVQFLSITDESYERKYVYLNDLQDAVGDLSDLTTTEKSNLVAAINELAASGKDFYITPTEINSDLGTNVYALDKTIDEINAALEADAHVWFVYTDADAEWKIPMVRQLATLAIADGILYFHSMINPQYVVAVTIRNYNGTAGAVIETGTVFPSDGTDGQVLTLVSGSPAWADASGGGAEKFVINSTGLSSGDGQAGSIYTVDKTIAEINEAYNAGKDLAFCITDTVEDMATKLVLPFVQYIGDGSWVMYSFGGTGGAESVTSFAVLVYEADGGTAVARLVGSAEVPTTTLPTGGTAGQVLTIADDGSVVWADPTGGTGSVASAEGVEF